jgi:transposase-like protein
LSEWYAAALADQAASGISVAEYAARLGVSVPTLYQWRRRLGSPGRDTAAVDTKLVEVTLARPEPVANTLVVRVCAGRRSIEVPRGFDDDELRRLIAVIESC